MYNLKVFTGRAHPELAREICSRLGVELGDADIFKFSNDNSFVKINESVREDDVFVVQPSCYPVNDGLMELIMIDALKRASVPDYRGATLFSIWAIRQEGSAPASRLPPVSSPICWR